MKGSVRIYLVCGVIVLLMALFASARVGQEEKPFAENKFVLQISDMDPDKQTLVLNVASNIMKHYGQDQADVEISSGTPRFDAVVEAATSRVRPVMMGALTTVLGVVLLLFDAFFQSMAVVLIFGLSFATILTLIIVPVLYAMFFRISAEEVRHADT